MDELKRWENHIFVSVVGDVLQHDKGMLQDELQNTTNMETTPFPRSIYIGPGQAPPRAQPKPKMIPPNRFLGTPFFFGSTTISFPCKVLRLPFLNKYMMTTPMATADPITPYMWNDCSLNIS